MSAPDNTREVSTDLRDFALEYLRDHGPSTVPDMSTNGTAPADKLRPVLQSLERDGQVERAGHTSATRADGRPTGGPRAVLWRIA